MDEDKFREAMLLACNVKDKRLREIAVNGLLDIKESDGELQKIFARALERSEY